MRTQKKILCAVIFLSWSLMGFTWGDILARNTKKGNDLFDAGQYDEALQAFTEADVNSKAGDPRLPKLYKNMGNTLIKQEKYDQAVSMYQKAFEASDNTSFKADVQYNAGNAWFKQKQYQQALEAYKQALELNPKHRRAQQNKELVEKLIVQPSPQQQQQQQPQNQDKQNEEQQQNQQQQQAQNQQDENKPDEEQQSQENQQQEEQQNQQQAQEQQAATAQEEPEDKEQELSEEEALRILDALKEKEQLQQQPVQLPPRAVEKDW